MPENPIVTGYTGTALIQPTVGEATGQFGIDFRADITAIAQKVRFLDDAGTINNPAWAAPSLLNSWVNPSGYACGYYKGRDGIVRIRSGVQGGVTGTVAFVLPVGFRPTQSMVLSVTGFLTNYTGLGSGAGFVQIDSSGNVTIFISGTTVCISLDISFPTN